MSTEARTQFKLDIGSGEGSSLGAYGDSSWVGIDSSEDVISRISKKYPYNYFVVADAENLPFANGQFVQVVASHVLEHVKNPGNAVEEMARVTSQNGRIRVAVPASRYEKVMNWIMNGSYQEMHVNLFSTDSVSELVSQSGVQVDVKENRKWWAAVSIIGRSFFFKRLRPLFEMNENTGLWELKQTTLKGKVLKKGMETVVYIFEKISKGIDKVGLGKYLNSVFPFEHYVEASKKD